MKRIISTSKRARKIDPQVIIDGLGAEPILPPPLPESQDDGPVEVYAGSAWAGLRDLIYYDFVQPIGQLFAKRTPLAAPDDKHCWHGNYTDWKHNDLHGGWTRKEFCCYCSATRMIAHRYLQRPKDGHGKNVVDWYTADVTMKANLEAYEPCSR